MILRHAWHRTQRRFRGSAVPENRGQRREVWRIRWPLRRCRSKASLATLPRTLPAWSSLPQPLYRTRSCFSKTNRDGNYHAVRHERPRAHRPAEKMDFPRPDHAHPFFTTLVALSSRIARVKLDIDNLTLDDEATYKLFSRRHHGHPSSFNPRHARYPSLPPAHPHRRSDRAQRPLSPWPHSGRHDRTTSSTVTARQDR